VESTSFSASSGSGSGSASASASGARFEDAKYRTESGRSATTRVPIFASTRQQQPNRRTPRSKADTQGLTADPNDKTKFWVTDPEAFVRALEGGAFDSSDSSGDDPAAAIDKDILEASAAVQQIIEKQSKTDTTTSDASTGAADATATSTGGSDTATDAASEGPPINPLRALQREALEVCRNQKKSVEAALQTAMATAAQSTSASVTAQAMRSQRILQRKLDLLAVEEAELMAIDPDDPKYQAAVDDTDELDYTTPLPPVSRMSKRAAAAAAAELAKSKIVPRDPDPE
jgi:hypothetical protein